MRIDRALTLSVFGPLRGVVSPGASGIPILMYHSIAPDLDDSRAPLLPHRDFADGLCSTSRLPAGERLFGDQPVTGDRVGSVTHPARRRRVRARS